MELDMVEQKGIAMYCNVLQFTAMYSNIPQLTAIYSNVLQVTIMYSSVQQYPTLHSTCHTMHCEVNKTLHYIKVGWTVHLTTLQCSALHCTALHCTALHCTALNCTALHCTALHCTALHCTALHCTALHCAALHCISAGWTNAAYLAPCQHFCTALSCKTDDYSWDKSYQAVRDKKKVFKKSFETLLNWSLKLASYIMVLGSSAKTLNL